MLSKVALLLLLLQCCANLPPRTSKLHFQLDIARRGDSPLTTQTNITDETCRFRLWNRRTTSYPNSTSIVRVRLPINIQPQHPNETT